MYLTTRMRMDFQEKVEELMQRNGIGYVTDLARAVTGEDPLSHKTKTNFNRYVKHGIRMPDNLREPLAKALHTTVDYLFTSEEKEHRVGFIPVVGKTSSPIPGDLYTDGTAYMPVPAKFSGKGCYIVESEDDSMFPVITCGMLLVCDKEAVIEHGDIVHYTLGGAGGIKKYHRSKNRELITLLPLNLNGYEPIIIHEEHISELNMAKCVFFMGYL
jgi:SOS-response transcriptional repressor LexA